MNNTTAQAHFDKCLGTLWKNKQFVLYAVVFENYHPKQIVDNQKGLVNVKISRSGADVKTLRDAFRAYLGKFLTQTESMTCWLNIYDSRISIYTGFDAKKRITENPWTNSELIEALQVLIDNCRIS